MDPEQAVLVVGAGAWGTALASVCARAGVRTLLWDSDAAVMSAMQSTRRHPRFASDRELEPLIEPVLALAALPPLGAIIMVVPFQALRAALTSVTQALPAPAAIACASKGFELSSGMMAHEIVAEVCGPALPFAQLSGPNFAAEVMRGSPAAITIGASTAALGRRLAATLHGPAFRAYHTDDVIGVEVGGAIKNVIAIAAGIADGLALGANTRAALITRGLAEMARFGTARGGRMETFMGLSGIGDLVLTCTDDQSRNRRFGIALAQCGSPHEAEAKVGALVEGVPTAHAIAAMARNDGIEMPIVAEVAQVLAGDTSPREAVKRLLAREPRVETA